MPRYFFRIFMILIAVFPGSDSAFAKVTTYIVETQEERKSTRFTLTEWLRIKERMKMMDLWLAMFSEPEKEMFRPELGIFAVKTEGTTRISGLNLQPSDAEKSEALEYESVAAHGQIWLTNLISSTVGIRTLNVDLGFEAMLRRSTLILPEIGLVPARVLSARSGVSSARFNNISLRIFGKSLQDSSLVLRYGEYSFHTDLMEYLGYDHSGKYSGSGFGGELQLYFSNWLGVSGSLTSYQDAVTKDLEFSGNYSEGGIFIEISLIRVSAGMMKEEWQFSDLQNRSKFKSNTTGKYVALKLHF